MDQIGHFNIKKPQKNEIDSSKHLQIRNMYNSSEIS